MLIWQRQESIGFWLLAWVCWVWLKRYQVSFYGLASPLAGAEVVVVGVEEVEVAEED